MTDLPKPPESVGTQEHTKTNRMFELIPISPLRALLPATVIPDLPMSDEDLELASAVALDSARIRCERDEHRRIRLYAPTPEPIWLMIQMIRREFITWINQKQAGGQIGLRRRLFLDNSSIICPDLAYFAPGADKIRINIEFGRILRVRPACVVEICPHLRDLPQYKNRMLRGMMGGIQVGMLIFPQEQRANIYTLDSEPETIDGDYVVGTEGLEGLVIKLSALWKLDAYRRG